jgi:hypothetical protein
MADVLDVRKCLAFVNARIVELRRALSHRHDDAVWWAERGRAAPAAQRELRKLAPIAHLLHTERAASRGHLHGQFATLEEQRQALDAAAEWRCDFGWPWGQSILAGVPYDITLAKLRAGVPLESAA